MFVVVRCSPTQVCTFHDGCKQACLLTPIVESTYLNRDMCKFESSQKDESRWQSTDSSKTYRNTSAFKCSPTQFYIWQKTGCGIRYFLSFETENWKCWLLRHYINFLCELNFIGQQIYHREQDIVQIFTHMKLSNLTLLTSKLY